MLLHHRTPYSHKHFSYQHVLRRKSKNLEETDAEPGRTSQFINPLHALASPFLPLALQEVSHLLAYTDISHIYAKHV